MQGVDAGRLRSRAPKFRRVIAASLWLWSGVWLWIFAGGGYSWVKWSGASPPVGAARALEVQDVVGPQALGVGPARLGVARAPLDIARERELALGVAEVALVPGGVE